MPEVWTLLTVASLICLRCDLSRSLIWEKPETIFALAVEAVAAVDEVPPVADVGVWIGLPSASESGR